MHAKSRIKTGALALFMLGCAIVCTTFVAHAQSVDPNAGGGAGAGDSPDAQAVDPLVSSAELSQQGILGCLGQGARVAANPGTTRAIGGVYVPVNDAAVTLNTGFLVYKECILDGMARKISENVSAELGREALAAYASGRAGNAQYVRNPSAEITQLQIENTIARLSESSLSSMCSAFRQPVRNAIVRSVHLSTNSPGSIYTCPFTQGGGYYDNWFATVGVGNVFSANAVTLGEIARTNAIIDRDTRQSWDWGRGTYSAYSNDADPLARQILTPGFIIADGISQITGSGYRQLEMANEIDQVVANLWGGLSTRLLAGSSGVPGLFVSTGNQPAYINRMVAQTQAAVRAGAVNAALVSLSATRANEARYLAAKQATGNALLNAINNLRAYENQCWNLIIPEVQAAAGSGTTLNIATSTQFSQPIIDSQIRATASTTAEEIRVSQQSLVRIDQLVTQVTSTTSPAGQQQAILQIDQMVATGQLHSDQDAQNAESQRDSVASALTTLLANTKTQWGDSTDPNVGWCNVSSNNPNKAQVVQRWLDAWN